jgi:hypothetical protein
MCDLGGHDFATDTRDGEITLMHVIIDKSCFNLEALVAQPLRCPNLAVGAT